MYFAKMARLVRFVAKTICKTFSQNQVGIGLGIGCKVSSAGGFVFGSGFGAGRASIENAKYEDNSGNECVADYPDYIFSGKKSFIYCISGKLY